MGAAWLALLAVLSAPGLAVGAAPGPVVGTVTNRVERTTWVPPAAGDTVTPPQYFAPIEHLPLDPPLRLSGTFGEYRTGHFHAGLDFATGERVGRPVYAVLPGHVARVRASGVGYGRSVYLQADDGRLVVYAHLDAFAEPLAGWVAAVQDSGGEYEQDLWPDPARFRVRAGQRLGWSGRSGTDAPHLHFEIRRGDVAYNPLLAGVAVEDTSAPVFRHVALMPVRPAPDSPSPAQAPVLECYGNDTTLVVGVGRLVAEVVDARGDGRRTMAPWRVSVEGGPSPVECRFDSVSWAEGMSEVDFVYDRGRTLSGGRHALVLGSPADFRPRVLRSPEPPGVPVGDLEIPPGGRPLSLRLVAQDVAGHVTVQTVALDAGPALGSGTGIPGGVRVAADSAATDGAGDFAWSAAPGTLFESECLETVRLGRPEAPEELRARSHVYALEPALTPLRRPLRVRIRDATAADQRRLGARGPGLYRATATGWERLGGTLDPNTGWVEAETRTLGSFALFRDVSAPRLRVLAPPRVAPAGDYPRWALEVAVEEEGSGVDARATRLTVDGRRVPAEWDAVAGRLRWRPLRPPASGHHEVDVVAADRAGNTRRRHASFVLD